MNPAIEREKGEFEKINKNAFTHPLIPSVEGS
jgi:hypothetical protein